LADMNLFLYGVRVIGMVALTGTRRLDQRRTFGLLVIAGERLLSPDVEQ
jgi:hypothetical protein